jgi:hypothetical protein
MVIINLRDTIYVPHGGDIDWTGAIMMHKDGCGIIPSWQSVPGAIIDIKSPFVIKWPPGAKLSKPQPEQLKVCAQETDRGDRVVTDTCPSHRKRGCNPHIDWMYIAWPNSRLRIDCTRATAVQRCSATFPFLA